jgi:hypothetical protein
MVSIESILYQFSLLLIPNTTTTSANTSCVICCVFRTGMACEFQTNEKKSGDGQDVEACGGLVCLNGGKCATTITTDSNGDKQEVQHCDCSSAVTGSDFFTGTQCEYKQTSFCSQPGVFVASADFCTNGGTCRENILSGCDCPYAFTGFRCEYQKDTDDLVKQADDPKLVDDYVECGDDYCYNGGTCVNSLGQTDYRCSCDTASTDSTLYAGTHCQYEMTSLCTKGTLDSLASADFCVNNGRCPEGEEDVGCSCPSGYTGYRCDESLYAYHDNEDNVAPDLDDDDDDTFYQCRLQCQNGGICAKGAKDLTHYHGAVDHVAHLNQTYDDTYFEHCVCKVGWVSFCCARVVLTWDYSNVYMFRAFSLGWSAHTRLKFAGLTNTCASMDRNVSRTIKSMAATAPKRTRRLMALSIRCLQGILANTQQLIYAPTETPLLGAHCTSARTTEPAKTMSRRPTQTQVASALQIGPAHTVR